MGINDGCKREVGAEEFIPLLGIADEPLHDATDEGI